MNLFKSFPFIQVWIIFTTSLLYLLVLLFELRGPLLLPGQFFLQVFILFQPLKWFIMHSNGSTTEFDLITHLFFLIFKLLVKLFAESLHSVNALVQSALGLLQLFGEVQLKLQRKSECIDEWRESSVETSYQ